MSWIGAIGAGFLARLRAINHLAATAGTLLLLAARRRNWPRTTRMVFARQILFTGVEAARFVSLIAVLTGVSVVVQTQVWLSQMGQAEMFGSIFVMVIVREVAPLLVNFIIIGRSGTAIATELANMKVTGEIRVLEAQGLDPLRYLALPRVFGMMVSVFCLTIVFIIISLLSGFVSGLLMGLPGDQLDFFVDSVLKALCPGDIPNLLAKTLVPGFLTALICLVEGLKVKGAITEVPQACTRGVVRSISMLFVVSAVVTMLLYF